MSVIPPETAFPAASAAAQAAWPAGDGEMYARIRAHDWAATLIGPIDAWPQGLCTAVDMVLAMPGPATILWGPAHIQLYNDAYSAIAKDRHPAILGRPAAESWPEIHAEVLAPVMQAAFAGRATTLADLSVALRGPDGRVEERAFDSTWSPIPDGSGGIGGALEILVEVTERRRTEASLRESEARHRLLIQSWAQAVWETDANGVVTADSPSWRAYTGQSLEEWLGYGWLGAIHPDDRTYAEQQWREAIAAHGPVDAEFRLRAADGGWRWTNVRAVPVLDAGGRIEKWAGMNIDIDARKRAEAALQESEERQTFMLRLSDALRPLNSASEIRLTAANVLGQRLGAGRVAYAEDCGDGRFFNVTQNFVAGAADVVGRYRYADYGGDIFSELQAGRTRVQPDIADDARLSDPEKKALAGANVGASLNVPLVKDGRLVAFLGVNYPAAHVFPAHEINLVREVAERTWAAIERARAEAALHASEELRRIALDGGSMGAWRWDLRNRLIWGDARFLSLWGHPPSEGPLPLALFTDRLSPDGTAEMEVVVTRAIEAGEEFDGQLQIVSGPTAGSWVRWRGRPDGPGSRILHGVGFDTTEQMRAAAALRESEERFRAFADNSADTIWITNGDATRLEYLSPAFERMFGEAREPVLADIHRWVGLVHPDDRGGARKAMPRALAGERAVAHYRVVRPSDGSVVHVRDTGFPIRDEGGRVIRVAGIVQDVTDVVRAGEALEAEKERFRVLAEGIPSLVWRSCDEGRWTWASPQWRNYTGQSDKESRGLGWLDAVHPEDRGRAEAAWHEARPHGQLDVEYRVRRTADGSWRWHQTRSVPVRNGPTMEQPDGRILEWLGTTTDIEDLKRLQGQQEMLVAELQHRTRNLLGVVRNVARRSIAPSPDRDEYDARLAALGRVQGFLSRSHLYAVPLADLLEAELHAAGDGASDKVVVSGPPVELPGEGVQAVALALHELATNAVKYGAIGQPAGRLSVTWHVEAGSVEGGRLVIDWRESGVVMPSGPPARRGYGSELIERALPYQLRAETALEFTPDGVRCRIVLPPGAFNTGTRTKLV